MCVRWGMPSASEAGSAFPSEAAECSEALRRLWSQGNTRETHYL